MRAQPDSWIPDHKGQTRYVRWSWSCKCSRLAWNRWRRWWHRRDTSCPRRSSPRRSPRWGRSPGVPSLISGKRFERIKSGLSGSNPDGPGHQTRYSKELSITSIFLHCFVSHILKSECYSMNIQSSLADIILHELWFLFTECLQLIRNKTWSKICHQLKRSASKEWLSQIRSNLSPGYVLRSSLIQYLNEHW